MSLAADARDAVRANPFLLDALRAGVVNHTAAADFLALDGDREAVAAALRRFAADLDDYETSERDVRVTMQSRVGVVSVVDGGEHGESDAADDTDTDPLLTLGGVAVADGDRETAVLATGEVDTAGLRAVLGRLAAADVSVSAAAVAGDTLLVVVGRRDGANALRLVEDALSAVAG
ncbi:hypothetical protein SAMN04487949_1298 [Halogranum gelatinilyticum]|uniref:Uncharacterized protein n=1 Tax=Halogranum gelatinilyticum TaxID=660521 RepID=A0A1G9RE39_9EURY|nr:hypothetical protein [Halogranum gelatinilyticum]SDM21451.1 hypothetical protein SAMN04487949_1298 [Halogranum gelatinilyticum]